MTTLYKGRAQDPSQIIRNIISIYETYKAYGLYLINGCLSSPQKSGEYKTTPNTYIPDMTIYKLRMFDIFDRYVENIV